MDRPEVADADDLVAAAPRMVAATTCGGRFSTRLNAHGVAPHVVERLLNHRLKGVAAAYNHADYDDERREALEDWSAWLLDLADARPAEVVPLRKAVAHG